jgi:hypothetical protein
MPNETGESTQRSPSRVLRKLAHTLEKESMRLERNEPLNRRETPLALPTDIHTNRIEQPFLQLTRHLCELVFRDQSAVRKGVPAVTAEGRIRLVEEAIRTSPIDRFRRT